MKKIKLFLPLIVVMLLVSCADVEVINKCLVNEPYGFFSGLWHGLTLPISFIGSLFSDDIAIYAVNNSGNWYDFGFVWGVGIVFGGTTYYSK